jgi:hypothetical protein
LASEGDSYYVIWIYNNGVKRTQVACKLQFNPHGNTIQTTCWRNFMKTLTVMTVAALALVATTPAFAGRDALEMAQIQRAMAAKKVEQVAQAKQVQRGLAGATGLSGKLGPSTLAPRAGRKDPTAHP